MNADQSYFWTEAWQKGELAADRNIEEGRYEVFDEVMFLRRVGSHDRALEQP